MPTPDIPEELRGLIDVLNTRAEGLDDLLRKLGLYVEGGQVIGADTPLGVRPVLVLHCQIGDVAFTERVQDPETAAFNDQFRVMEAEQGTSDFLDAHQQMQRNIAAGRDPLDDGDGDDEA